MPAHNTLRVQLVQQHNAIIARLIGRSEGLPRVPWSQQSVSRGAHIFDFNIASPAAIRIDFLDFVKHSRFAEDCRPNNLHTRWRYSGQQFGCLPESRFPGTQAYLRLDTACRIRQVYDEARESRSHHIYFSGHINFLMTQCVKHV